MRCSFCSKKSGVCLNCSRCEKELCTNCIQLEIHECEGYLNKINELKKILERNNPLIERDKVPHRLI